MSGEPLPEGTKLRLSSVCRESWRKDRRLAPSSQTPAENRWKRGYSSPFSTQIIIDTRRMVSGGEVLLAERASCGGHGTFGEDQIRPKAQSLSARYSRIALAVAVVALVALVGFHSVQPVELLDDVTHDGATESIMSKKAVAGRGNLNAHSSIQDFFNAAMRGDFQKRSNVKLATDGLFDGQAHSPSLASYQSLASRRLRTKAVHFVHPEKQVARKSVQIKQHQTALRLPGGAVVHHASKLHGVSENNWKYPTEDKFVARYTGALPEGVVQVDSFTSGPYVPI